jgi:hypothetical protein
VALRVLVAEASKYIQGANAVEPWPPTAEPMRARVIGGETDQRTHFLVFVIAR